MKKLIFAAICTIGLNSMAGNDVIAPADELKNETIKYIDATVRTITNDRPQQVWIPVAILVDNGIASGTNTATIAYIPTGHTQEFRIGAVTSVQGAETLTALGSYPALSYGDKFQITMSETNMAAVVTLIKKVIPR